MLSIIIDMLNKNPNVDEWLINDKHIESAELFFIRKNLDMNRAKDVHHINITVYKNFEEVGKKLKGSANTRLSPSMSEEEIAGKIEQAALAATFVKNPYYTLVQPTSEVLPEVQSQFSMDELSAFMPQIVQTIYKNDNKENGKINSCEFFLEKTRNIVLNSSGVDEQYTSYKGHIGLIVDWKETGEEIEVRELFDFSDLDPEKIERVSAVALENAKLRANAQPTPKLSVPVILTDYCVAEFLRYYYEQANAKLVYQKYSTAKVGDDIQGSEIIGDKINLTLMPEIENSASNAYIDPDGVKLKETSVYRDGKLLCYHGDNRHCQYLNIETTGVIGNVKVDGGSKAVAELKKEPYLELKLFSDFQMDEWTGDFGGEIRLALYFDGEKTIPVSGGSIVGNIKTEQANMLLSSEMQTSGNYLCPMAVKMFGVTVAV